MSLSPPIAENPDVKQLLDLMKANKLPGAKDLITVVGQVTSMEKHLADMLKELAAMRLELAEAQRQNHPLKNALRNAVIVMQANVLDLRDKLTALKQDIAVGCRDALAAVHDKGISALRNISDFIKLRPALESMRGNIDMAIGQDSRSINKIEAASVEYHRAGLHIVNIARVAAGKEIKQEPKAPGVLAKALQAPILVDRACLYGMGQCVDKAIGAVDRLKATERKEPIMDTLKKMEQKVNEAQRDTPARARADPDHGDR
jgi:regulator of replication initiation timing